MAVLLRDPVNNFAPRPTIDLRSKKLFWSIFPLLLLVLGLGFTLQQARQQQRLETQASGGVVLSFLTSQMRVKSGEVIDIDVFMDNREQTVSQGDLYITFPDKHFEALGISAGDYFSELLEPGVVGPGAAFIKVGSGMSKMGIGSIAKLRLRARDPGEGSIQFSSETTITDRMVSGEIPMNLIDKAIGLELIIE